MTLVALLTLAVLVGVVLSALGGGGSILTVPLLVYVAHLEAKQAIATSLLVVGVTSLAGLFTHARAGRVRWRTGLLFGLGAMVGAFAGGVVGGYIPGELLLLAFAVMMLATGLAMLRGNRSERVPSRSDSHLALVLANGVVVGLVTGMVGAGGGFLVVPALVLLGGLSMTTAIGTSLLVIAMKSFAGLAGYLMSVSIAWDLAGSVTAAAVIGTIAGSWLTGRIREFRLRRIFGHFVLVMGALVLLEQLAPSSWPTVGLTLLILVVAAAWRTRLLRPAVGRET